MKLPRLMMRLIFFGFYWLLGVTGEAYASPISVTYYFDGIDIETETVYHDPTSLLVLFGPEDEIQRLLKPASSLFPNFGEHRDLDYRLRGGHYLCHHGFEG